MKKTTITFGLLITALLILFQLGKYRLIKGDVSMELIISVVAVVFLFVGMYIRKYHLNVVVQNANKQEINYEKIRSLKLSEREIEVLAALVSGLTNKEIGEKLFISESTVKSHVSNIFSKLQVRNRPEAIIRATELRLV